MPRRAASAPGQLTRRRFVPEFMDDPLIDPAELAASLRFIRLVNARLGGASAALGHVRRWTKEWPADRPLLVLDVGTGAADIPLALLRWGRSRGLCLRITAVDNHARTLECARAYLMAQGVTVGDLEEPTGSIELVQEDARALARRFPATRFDISHAGMFLHHLPDVEILTVLRIMERLSRIALIWNDLVRDPVSAVAIRLLTLGMPAAIRHDAVVSVEKGFKRREAIDLARRSGLREIEHRRHLFGRFTLTARGMEG
jgi:2-polyprenyl-3-methyl-5-hydroxy-6-metoxy-1,4-benzoquinol methylase